MKDKLTRIEEKVDRILNSLREETVSIKIKQPKESMWKKTNFVIPVQIEGKEIANIVSREIDKRNKITRRL